MSKSHPYLPLALLCGTVAQLPAWAADPVGTELPKLTVNGSDESVYITPSASSATKSDTPVMETPINVQVIPEYLLKEQQATTLDQALTNVSGVVSNAWSVYGEESITLRGFQTSTVFIDGFRFIEYGGFGLRNLSDAEGIEVMKGPAAILYGAVEPGGMVNIITKKPQATPYTAVSVSAGSWDHYITDLDSAGALNKDATLLYRLDATYETTHSWHVGDWMQKTYVSPSLTWLVSSATKIHLKLSYEDNPYANDNGEVVPYFNGQFVPISRSQNLLAPYPITINGRRDQEWLDWSHDFDSRWTVRQVFVRSKAADAGSSANIYGFNYDPTGLILQATQSGYGFKGHEETLATELDLEGHFTALGAKHTLLLGADYYRVTNGGPLYVPLDFAPPTTINVNAPNPFPIVAPPLDTVAAFDGDTVTYNKGLYVQDEIKLPHGIDITAGLRYQRVDQGGWNATGPAFGGDGSHVPNAPFTVPSATTPRLGALWEATPWLSLYAHYAGGFNPNYGVNWQGIPLKPTDAREKEIGAKTTWLDGKAFASVALFDLTKTNIPVCDPDLAHNPFGCTAPAPPGASIPSTTIGAVRSRGVEFDLKGELLPHWNALLTYAYTDARVSESSFSPDTSNSFLVGQTMPSTPKNMASLWTTYAFDAGALKNWTTGGGVTYRGGSMDATNTIVTPGYPVVSAMASYHSTWNRRPVTYQINVNNLFNKSYLNIANWASGSSGNLVNAVYGDPRSAMATVRFEF